MRALVTGGGGFLGSHLASALLKRGHSVAVLGRNQYPSLDPAIKIFQADIRDREKVFRAIEGMDAVFHAAAIPGIWGPRELYQSVNVDGTQNVIDACLEHGVGKLVYTSSPSVVYNNANMENLDETAPYPKKYLCEYPRTKAIAERMVMQANGTGKLSTVSLRPHLIWGAGDAHLIPRIISRAKKGQLIRVGDGKNLVDVIYIDNAVEAHLLACDALEPNSTAAGNCYFISDGEAVNLWQWISGLLARLDIPPIKRSISYRAAYCLGGALEALYTLLGKKEEPRMTRFLAATLATSHYFDSSAARRDFNYRPIVDPEEGMQKLIESLQARPPN